MDQIPATPANMPHIVQVYQHSVTNSKIPNPQLIHITSSLQTQKVTYQQSIPTDIHIPTSEVREMHSQQIPSQIAVTCHQTPHIQSIHPVPSMQSQVLQNDMSQQLFTSHVLLPQVPLFKPHMLVDGTQYYSQYDAYVKDPHDIISKVDPEVPIVTDKHIEPASDKWDVAMQKDTVMSPEKKKPRSQMPNPSNWACNVRKLKHQKGEAYINRRGKFVPERQVRTTKNCLTSCKFKCNERINDVDREHIFKAFYSLNANEKKHFLLNTTERNYVKQYTTRKRTRNENGNSKRKYSFKYFFLVRSVRYTVCKNFYLGTLAISQKPVYNVHLGKSDMNIPKPDGRGLSEASTHALSPDMKDRVRRHIMTFKTEDSKPVKQFSKKKQYLDPSLSIKQMYSMYTEECSKENVASVKESMYRKIFKQDFNLHFKKIKSELCCKCKGPIKKK